MQIDWAEFGLAGLFAVFALILIKSVLDFLKDERIQQAAATKEQQAIQASTHAQTVAVLQQMTVALTSLTQLMHDHDTRVQATMDIMQQAVGLDIGASPHIHTSLRDRPPK